MSRRVTLGASRACRDHADGRQQLRGSRMAPDNLLGPWAGFALFCGYAAAVGLVAAAVLRRRDA